MERPLLRSVKAAEIVKIVDVVDAVHILESTSYWMYVDVGDDRTCVQCSEYSGSVFTTEEINSLFPDSADQDDELILPNVHNFCRCMLVGKAEDWTPGSFPVVVGSAAEEPAAANPFDVSLWGLERAPRVHDDFLRIRKAFMKVYGPQQGGKEFLKWLRKNRLAPHHSYGQRWNSKAHNHKN